eukprot:6178721-Pleurochrysis_carterae.AAC.2
MALTGVRCQCHCCLYSAGGAGQVRAAQAGRQGRSPLARLPHAHVGGNQEVCGAGAGAVRARGPPRLIAHLSRLHRASISGCRSGFDLLKPSPGLPPYSRVLLLDLVRRAGSPRLHRPRDAHAAEAVPGQRAGGRHALVPLVLSAHGHALVRLWHQGLWRRERDGGALGAHAAGAAPRGHESSLGLCMP